jgi:hypothetical protein
MANKKRTLKRRKIRGGFWGSNQDNKKVDTGTGNDASNTTKKDQINDSTEGINTDDIKFEEKVPPQTPPPKNTWSLFGWLGLGSKQQPQPTGNASNQLGGKRKTNKRKSKRNTSQQKR